MYNVKKWTDRKQDGFIVSVEDFCRERCTFWIKESEEKNCVYNLDFLTTFADLLDTISSNYMYREDNCKWTCYTDEAQIKTLILKSNLLVLTYINKERNITLQKTIRTDDNVFAMYFEGMIQEFLMNIFEVEEKNIYKENIYYKKYNNDEIDF